MTISDVFRNACTQAHIKYQTDLFYNNKFNAGINHNIINDRYDPNYIPCSCYIRKPIATDCSKTIVEHVYEYLSNIDYLTTCSRKWNENPYDHHWVECEFGGQIWIVDPLVRIDPLTICNRVPDKLGGLLSFVTPDNHRELPYLILCCKKSDLEDVKDELQIVDYFK